MNVVLYLLGCVVLPMALANKRTCWCSLKLGSTYTSSLPTHVFSGFMIGCKRYPEKCQSHCEGEAKKKLASATVPIDYSGKLQACALLRSAGKLTETKETYEVHYSKKTSNCGDEYSPSIGSAECTCNVQIGGNYLYTINIGDAVNGLVPSCTQIKINCEAQCRNKVKDRFAGFIFGFTEGGKQRACDQLKSADRMTSDVKPYNVSYWSNTRSCGDNQVKLGTTNCGVSTCSCGLYVGEDYFPANSYKLYDGFVPACSKLQPNCEDRCYRSVESMYKGKIPMDKASEGKMCDFMEAQNRFKGSGDYNLDVSVFKSINPCGKVNTKVGKICCSVLDLRDFHVPEKYWPNGNPLLAGTCDEAKNGALMARALG